MSDEIVMLCRNVINMWSARIFFWGVTVLKEPYSFVTTTAFGCALIKV